MVDGWDSIRAGKYAEAIRRFSREYERDSDNISLMDLGSAYIFDHRLDDAAQAFERLIEIDPRHISYHYERLGLVYWLRETPDRAVAIWKEGQRCGYSDGAGGLTLPLLLWFASIRIPNIADEDEVIRRIQKKCSSGWSRNWPGPIGHYVLGKISESELRDRAMAENEPPICDTGPMAQAEFYIGVKNLQRDERAFSERLRTCAELSSYFFLCEQHLARFELERTGPIDCAIDISAEDTGKSTKRKVASRRPTKRGRKGKKKK